MSARSCSAACCRIAVGWVCHRSSKSAGSTGVAHCKTRWITYLGGSLVRLGVKDCSGARAVNVGGRLGPACAEQLAAVAYRVPQPERLSAERSRATVLAPVRMANPSSSSRTVTVEVVSTGTPAAASRPCWPGPAAPNAGAARVAAAGTSSTAQPLVVRPLPVAVRPWPAQVWPGPVGRVERSAAGSRRGTRRPGAVIVCGVLGSSDLVRL